MTIATIVPMVAGIKYVSAMDCEGVAVGVGVGDAPTTPIVVFA
jgi:hypothetical protein